MLRAAIILSALFLLSSCVEPNGAYLFLHVGCTKCHVLNGVGIGRVDLSDVRNERSRGWVRDQITFPRSHRPDTGMPSFAFLSRSQINALADYVMGGQRPR